MSATTVYAICNHSTGEAYIGESGNAGERYRQHCSDLRCGRHHNRALQVAWDRDGAAAFGLVVLERVANTPRRGSAWNWAQEARWIARARAAGVVLYNDQVGKGRRRVA